MYSKAIISNKLTILIISSAFSFVLVIFRIYYSSSLRFVFLNWNLLLAWIPYLISIAAVANEMKNRKFYKTGMLISLWLLFFPNALYIFTDLFHLKQSNNMPLWYDLILIFSFTWNGFLLGFLSLHNIHSILSKRTNNKFGWIIITAFMTLSSFGVYLGRYLRWNSWDILFNFSNVISDISDRIFYPFAHMRSTGITIVFTAFMMMIYISMKMVLFEDLNSEVKSQVSDN